MSLVLIQMRPEMGRLIRWAQKAGVLAPQGADDLGYALHAILKAAFGEAAPKPFALLDPPGRRERPGHGPGAQLLGYAQGDVAGLRLAADLAAPDLSEALGLAELAAKAMPTHFAAGTRLGFRVRVRPMVRRDHDGDRTRTREQDAYLAAIESYPRDESGRGTAPMTRGEVYGTWLRGKLEAGGAQLEQAALEAFRLTRTLRRDALRDLRAVPDPRTARTMRGAAGHPDATFTGTLAVRDPDAFAALLARGVGRHRAFGFGMLLLRPAA